MADPERHTPLRGDIHNRVDIHLPEITPTAPWVVGCNGVSEGASWEMSAAVAAGSTPGEPSGRWVAGCCALGVQVHEVDQMTDAVKR